MNDHRYILERYKGPSSRHTCPGCGKKRIFVRYIDTENNGSYLAEHVGRCDREVNCGYHYKPKNYFEDNNIENPKPERFERRPKPTPKPAVNIPAQFVDVSMSRGTGSNNFIQFLHTLFEPFVVHSLIQLYKIGTSNGAKYWGGKDGASVIFWFINIAGGVRYGQVKLFNPDGHTAKFPDIRKDGELSSCTTGIHYIFKAIRKGQGQELPQWLADYEKQDIYLNCFFGEHLLSMPGYNARPVAIVEAPKTAIVASVFFPQFTWLAVGALSYLTAERCEVLRGRRVILFPDLGAFTKWSDRASELKHIASITVSDILEQSATPEQRRGGWDLCDYLCTDNVRRELIDSFKDSIITSGADTDSEHCAIWMEYAAKGLRKKDQLTAYRELIAAGAVEVVEDATLHPFYFDANISPINLK